MKNLKVKFKMTLLMVIVIVMMIGVGLMGVLTTQKMAGRSQETYSEDLLPISYVSQMRTNNRAIESYVLELMLNKDAAGKATLHELIDDKIKKNNDLLVQLNAISYSDANVKKKLNEYRALLPSYRAQWDQIIQLGDKNLEKEAYDLYSGDFSDYREKMIDMLKEVTNILLKGAESHNAANTSDANRFQTLSFVIIAVVLILCVLISFVITRLITKPLKELQELMQRAEQGDLTVSALYNSKDEIGVINGSFNRMLVSLRTMMLGVAESAEMLSASSEEMSASSEQTTLASQLIAETSGEIASGFEEQTANISRTSQAVQAMSEDISSVNQTTSEMSSLMGIVAESTDRGAVAVDEIIDQMKEIDASVSGSQVIVNNLANLSEEINTIITTINGIASQTSLLSLNASIEAARAGEQGRGFAVVAGEIRKLSEATGKSSLQITDIITHIQQQTESAMKSMARGSQLVSQGVTQSNLVSQAFSEIQASIKDATLQTADIRTAVEHISRESVGVKEAMEQVNVISNAGAEGIQDTSAASQEQLSAMEEMTSSAQYLATLAEDLQKSLSSFKL
ncbi:MAG: methyl-accepting chemotaxis protein [Paenibacillus sp.]|nr:methyl-accepting chemotaxis protein [Paenibacillus sp.]